MPRSLTYLLLVSAVLTGGCREPGLESELRQFPSGDHELRTGLATIGFTTRPDGGDWMAEALRPRWNWVESSTW